MSPPCDWQHRRCPRRSVCGTTTRGSRQDALHLCQLTNECVAHRRSLSKSVNESTQRRGIVNHPCFCSGAAPATRYAVTKPCILPISLVVSKETASPK